MPPRPLEPELAVSAGPSLVRRRGCYSERRKFSTFCFEASGSALKLLMTALASEPELAWAAIAVFRLLVRPVSTVFRQSGQNSEAGTASKLA
jgi:hypothetical protein